VRQLAEIADLQLIEINFEKRPDRADLFKSNDVHQILLELQSVSGHSIDPKKLSLAVRVNANLPTKTDVTLKNRGRDCWDKKTSKCKYKLLP